jgi:hypothetical protein
MGPFCSLWRELSSPLRPVVLRSMSQCFSHWNWPAKRWLRDIWSTDQRTVALAQLRLGCAHTEWLREWEPQVERLKVRCYSSWRT